MKYWEYYKKMICGMLDFCNYEYDVNIIQDKKIIVLNLLDICLLVFLLIYSIIRMPKSASTVYILNLIPFIRVLLGHFVNSLITREEYKTKYQTTPGLKKKSVYDLKLVFGLLVVTTTFVPYVIYADVSEAGNALAVLMMLWSNFDTFITINARIFNASITLS